MTFWSRYVHPLSSISPSLNHDPALKPPTHPYPYPNPGHLIGQSLDLESQLQERRDRAERERPPTEADVRKELGLPDDVMVRVVPFTAMGGAHSLDEAIRRLRAGYGGRAMPDTAAVTDAAEGEAPSTGTASQSQPAQGEWAPSPTEEYRDRKRVRRTANVAAEVMLEVMKAQRKHAPMHSIHEAYGVISEEFNIEFADAMHKDDIPQARKEAIQVAAMAIRFILDVADHH